MQPEVIRTLALEIVNQTILGNWLFYVVLACITIVLSAVGAFLSTYISKRAETAALVADFTELKRQLKETTTLSESIKIDIKHLAERSEKLQWLKREKLESYVVAVLQGTERLSTEMKHNLLDAEPPPTDDPLLTAAMLQKLYLPELDAQHAILQKATGEFRGWMAKGMQKRLDEWRATNVKPAPDKGTMDEYPNQLLRLNAAVMHVEQAAQELARKLNNV